jgi:hypothetical protein
MNEQQTNNELLNDSGEQVVCPRHRKEAEVKGLALQPRRYRKRSMGSIYKAPRAGDV